MCIRDRYINDRLVESEIIPGNYVSLHNKWKKNDIIRLELSIRTRLIESNPLVEETRNEIAIQRGPVVYCLESPDLPSGIRVSDIGIPKDIHLSPEKMEIEHAVLTALSGDALVINHKEWGNKLYREVPATPAEPLKIRLIPYFAWGNRGKSEMSVWMPVCR